MAGEESHEAGRKGVRRAKEWLERTGRVDVFWTAYEQPEMLTIKRPGGGARAFDLGGVIRGGELTGRLFYAEVKKYSSVGGQSAMYGDYLANCYCATLAEPDKQYEFMWITWHPFDQTKWTRLIEWEEVASALQSRTLDWLGRGAVVDDEVCRLTAERLWLIVLSDRQERLGMSDEMLGELARAAQAGTKR